MQNATLKGRLYETDRKHVQTFANIVENQSAVSVEKGKASVPIEVNTKAIKLKAKRTDRKIRTAST